MSKRDYFKNGRQRRPETVSIHLRIPKRDLEKWKQIAGDNKISRFIREAINCYVADIEEGSATTPQETAPGIC